MQKKKQVYNKVSQIFETSSNNNARILKILNFSRKKSGKTSSGFWIFYKYPIKLQGILNLKASPPRKIKLAYWLANQNQFHYLHVTSLYYEHPCFICQLWFRGHVFPSLCSRLQCLHTPLTSY